MLILKSKPNITDIKINLRKLKNERRFIKMFKSQDEDDPSNPEIYYNDQTSQGNDNSLSGSGRINSLSPYNRHMHNAS
jgi:hypothetical protein